MKIGTAAIFSGILLFLSFLPEFNLKVFGEGRNISKLFKLPSPNLLSEMSLEESLAKRRSKRSFSKEVLTWQEIGQILRAAQGITHPRGLRTVPSAGALYPLEIYFLTPEGIFHYLPAEKIIFGCFGANFY